MMVGLGGDHAWFINALNNLLVVFVILFGISPSLGTPTLTGAIKEYSAEEKKLASQNPGYISIDCGADEDYLDEDTGIFYKTDKDFINTGTNHEITSFHYKASIKNFQRQLNNLRSFPEGRRNCYALKVKEGKNNSYFIRILIYYGNYDGRNEAPVFDAYLGVNYWTQVATSTDDIWTMMDIVSVFSTDTQYVCLVNTGFGVPLISSLELRPLNHSIYRINSGTLTYIFSADVGLPGKYVVRYKDDVYNRIWFPYEFPDSVPINTSLDIETEGSENLYKLPPEVLRIAAQPSNGSTSLSYKYMANSTTNEFYVYFHFAEIVKIPQGQRREFTITLNGVKYGPISLEFLKPLSIRPQTSPIKGDIFFTIDATRESNLPPILNAFEIYQVVQLLSSPTHPFDVDAIKAIKVTYSINRADWQGDPCLPKEFRWNGLDCRYNNSNTPRIISLNLSASKLTGEISSSISNLHELESLDLSYNELKGQIPEVLAHLSKLKVLNLAGNKLTGLIPQSLKEMSDNGSLLLSLAENPDLCLMDPCNRKKKKLLVPVVASSVSVLILLILLGVPFIFYYIKRRRQGGSVIESKKEEPLKSKNRPFTYSEIVSITNNLTSIIGEGGFGKVYLGTLNDGTRVAVKLLSPSSKQGHKEFQTEVQLLMIVHHKKLVSLIGYCEEDGNMALVYEYMANGNLREHLSGTKSNALGWKERLQIAVDAAHGLEYLHDGCKPPIVHRDLKSSNILLTENMQAKIADFGLSKVFATEHASHISTGPAGTPGYLDPEFHRSGNLNRKSDVYSFGIILLELITGQPAVVSGPEYSIHILQWVTPIIDRGDIQSIIDPKLKGKFNINAVWKAVEIAMACSRPTANKRPDISHVLAELKECLTMDMDQMAPKNPQKTQTKNLEMPSYHSPPKTTSGAVDSYSTLSPR